MGMKQEIQKNKKYVKAGFWNVLGSFVLKGSGLLFSLYFASIMTQKEFGEVSTFTSYASILSVLVGLNLYSSLNNAKLEFRRDYRGYQSAILAFSLFSFLAVTVIAAIFMEPLAALLRMGRGDLMLLLVYSMSLYIMNFYQTANITRYRYKQNIIASCFNVFFGFGLSYVLVQWARQYDRVVTAKNIGATVPLVLIAAWVVLTTVGRGKKLVRPTYWKYAFAIAAPNIAHTLGQDILAQSDRIFIHQLVGAAEAGVYSLMHYFGMGMTLLWSGINGVWVPWLFTRLATGDKAGIRRNSYRYIWAFSVVTILMCMAAPLFVKWLMPPSYMTGVGMITPIVLSGYFMCLYSFMANLEFYHKKNGYIAMGTAAAAVANILMNMIFIPLFGYQAAATTTMVSYFLLFLFHYVVSTRVLRINIYRMRIFIVNIIFTCTACGLIGWLWGQVYR